MSYDDILGNRHIDYNGGENDNDDNDDDDTVNDDDNDDDDDFLFNDNPFLGIKVQEKNDDDSQSTHKQE